MSFINPNPAGGGGSGAVTSVNGQVGAVVLTAADVGAVSSVNGQSGVVVLDAADVGAVVSVNGQGGIVVLGANDVGAYSQAQTYTQAQVDAQIAAALAAYVPKVSILAQSAVQVSLTGTTVATVLASAVIPAGTMGVNDALEIDVCWSRGGSTTFVGMITRWATGPAQIQAALVATSNLSLRNHLIVMNRNSLTSQLSYGTDNDSITGGGYGTNTSAPYTSSVNTANAQTIQFVGQLLNAADTVRLESYCIKLLKA